MKNLQTFDEFINESYIDVINELKLKYEQSSDATKLADIKLAENVTKLVYSYFGLNQKDYIYVVDIKNNSSKENRDLFYAIDKKFNGESDQLSDQLITLPDLDFQYDKKLGVIKIVSKTKYDKMYLFLSNEYEKNSK